MKKMVAEVVDKGGKIGHVVFNPIERHPIMLGNGKVIPNRFALVDGKDGYVYDIVSDRYIPVPHKPLAKLFDKYVLSFADEVGSKDVTINTVFDHGQQTMKRSYLFNDLKYKIIKDDYVCFGMDVFNSYGGGKPIAYKFFGHRLVCTNGLWIKDKWASQTLRHFYQVEEFVEKMKFIMDKFPEQINRWKKWAKEPFPVPQAKKWVEERQKKDKMADFTAAWILENYVKQKIFTKWMFFNILTYYVTHIAAERARKQTVIASQLRAMEMMKFS